MITVCLLCYGDYPELAEQALGSIVRSVDWGLVQDLRIGLNVVSARTLRALRRLLKNVPVPWYVVQHVRGINVGKYPMMRRMFYDQALPGLAETVMWFDDDSYVMDTTSAWWQTIQRRMQDAELLGVVHKIRLRPGQLEGVKAQPWAVQPSLLVPLVPFVTGGWWTARSQLLRQWNYPFPPLHHNGGDSILGVLAAQQDWRVVDHREGVAVNAGLGGSLNQAKRRGVLRTTWPWERYKPGPPGATMHNVFDVTVMRNLKDVVWAD